MGTITQAGPPPSAVARRGRPGPPAARAQLLTGRFVVLLTASLGALTSFYLLLSVTPLEAAAAGAGSAGTGLVTGSLMLATVLAEFASPRLLRRYGHRAVFAAGGLLLGGPALALLAPRTVVTIVAVSTARGLGFGLSTVVTGALVAAALPRERRGEGLGLAGVAACVPAIVALPSGVWLAAHTSAATVIGLAAASALAPLMAVPALAGPAGHRPEAGPPPGPPAGLLASLRSAGQRRLALVFAATTVAAGVVAAFLPLAAGAAGGTAALGLLVQAVAATAARWWAGRYGDRHGQAGLLIPGLLAAAGGLILLVWVAVPAVALAALIVFGTGFGISQNVTFALMIDRAPAGGYSTVSALWNLAYDAGYGAGPVVFGAFVAGIGYPAAFALTGLLMLTGLVPAVRISPWTWRHPAPPG